MASLWSTPTVGWVSYVTNYAASTRVRISQKQRSDLRPCGQVWRFFPFGGAVPAGPDFPTLADALTWPELTARRAFAKPFDAPVAPLVPSRTGRPGELSLIDLPTIVNTPDPNGQKGERYRPRRERMIRVLTELGFTNWRFNYGATSIPYCASHCADQARLLRTMEPPWLFLEDDAEPAWPPSHFVPPIGATRLHIGGDWHGVDLARKLAWRTRRNWRRENGYLWVPYDRDWFFQAGMLAFHAIVWLNRQSAAATADYIEQKQGAVDAVVSELDGRFPAACPTRCWFWQNDGHNGQWSFNFAPPDIRRQPSTTCPP